MSVAHIAFSDEDQRCWEEGLLDLVQPRAEELPSDASAFSSARVANEPMPSLEAPLPPPPQWDDAASFAAFMEEGTEAMIEKRYSDAYAAFEVALGLNPDAQQANLIRGNLARLQELMQR